MEDAFAKIVVGQRLWGKVRIPSDGYILPEKRSEYSTVTRDIVNGKPVLKHLVVLQHNGDSLLVAYTTSFGQSKDLASHVTQVKDWYPVKPAVGSYEGLPEEPSKEGKKEESKEKEGEKTKEKTHAWFNLQHVLTLSRGDKYAVLEGNVYSEESVLILKNAIDERTGKENFKKETD